MQAIQKEDASGNPFADYMSRAEFAAKARITYRTAELWAHQRKGPRVTVIGGRAYYHADDVRAWLDSLRKRDARSQPKARSVA